MQPDGISAGIDTRAPSRRLAIPAEINIGGLLLPTRETIVVVVASIVLLLDWYHVLLPIDSPLATSVDRAVLYGLIPLAVLLLMAERPSRYGLCIGDWRLGVVSTVLAAVLVTPVLVVASGWADVHAYYHQDQLNLPVLLLANAVELSAAEFLYRGFLMMALVRWCGPFGVVLATFPFVFMHLGKPELETLSTVFGGIGFGWLAWRTGSVLYGAALHVYILTLVIVATSL